MDNALPIFQDWRDLPLWLWRVHNAVNLHVATRQNRWRFQSLLVIVCLTELKSLRPIFGQQSDDPETGIQCNSYSGRALKPWLHLKVSQTCTISVTEILPLWVFHSMQNASKCSMFFIFKGNSQAADKESFPDIKIGLKCHLKSHVAKGIKQGPWPFVEEWDLSSHCCFPLAVNGKNKQPRQANTRTRLIEDGPCTRHQNALGATLEGNVELLMGS